MAAAYSLVPPGPGRLLHTSLQAVHPLAHVLGGGCSVETAARWHIATRPELHDARHALSYSRDTFPGDATRWAIALFQCVEASRGGKPIFITANLDTRNVPGNSLLSCFSTFETDALSSRMNG
jgi:hypothetical protein